MLGLEELALPGVSVFPAMVAIVSLLLRCTAAYLLNRSCQCYDDRLILSSRFVFAEVRGSVVLEHTR